MPGRKDPDVSVLDELRGLEQRVIARLAELRPLVEEYEQLRQVAERYGFDADRTVQPSRRPAKRRARAGGRAAKAKPTASRGTASRRRASGTQAIGAERRERVLGMIREQPGITVPDMSKELGVDPPPLYRVVRKLEAEGLVRKEGKGIRPR